MPGVMGLVGIRSGIQLFSTFRKTSDLILPYVAAGATDPENLDDLFRIVREWGGGRVRASHTLYTALLILQCRCS